MSGKLLLAINASVLREVTILCPMRMQCLLESITTCMHAQPLEEETMQCAWVTLRVLLSPGLRVVPGEAMAHRVPLIQAPPQCLACLPAGWDRA